jgi:hypothetical protein
MKYSAAVLIALLLVCICASPVLADAGTIISVTEFRQQLSDLETKIGSLQEHPEGAGEISSAVPQEVKVETGTGQVTVSYKDLKNDLAMFSSGDANRKAAILPRLRNYVRTLKDEAAAFEKTAGDPAQARKKLDEILARKEFNRVRGPSFLELWVDKVLGWLARHLRPAGPGTWNVIQVLVYGLAASALGALLIWTVLRLAKPASGEDGGREIIPFSPSAKGWRTWLAEARGHADQQDWRNAIHLAYWAGISYLEEHGAWKPNRARTPREYLRLLGAWTPEHPPLAALTRKFEVVWYGHRPVSEPDFQETLGELERLGCR